MIKSTAIVLTAELVAKVLLFSFELYVVTILSTSELAAWVAISLGLRFAPYSTFGNIAYFNKYYPLPANTGNTVLFPVMGNILSLVLLYVAASLVLFLTRNVALGYATSFFALISLLALMQSYFRNKLAFGIYSSGIVLLSFIQLAICYLVGERYGLYGVLISVILANVVAIGFYFSLLPTGLLSQFKLQHNWAVYRLAVLPFGLAISSFVVQNADRVGLLIFSSELLLSEYASCFVFFQLGIVFVSSVAKVFTPFFLSSRKEEGDQRLILFSVFVASTCSVGLMVFGAFGEVLVDFLLPGSNYLVPVYMNYLYIGFAMAISQIFLVDYLREDKELIAIAILLIGSAVTLIGTLVSAAIFGDIHFVSSILVVIGTVTSLSVILFRFAADIAFRSKLCLSRTLVFGMLPLTYYLVVF